jgi:ParB-like chromosome segregation protein Spo0J
MEFDYQSVALTRIRITDATYCITDQKPSDELVRSIDDLGLIHPPILLPSKDKYVILSGFNRIAACRLLDRTHVTAGVVHPDTSAAKCAIIAVADTTVRRNLNLVEQARAIGLLSRFYDRKETLDAAARRVGLKWSEHLAAKLKKVTRMTPLLQSGLTCGTIALPVALAIHDMTDHEGANAISRILHSADYSLSQQR